LVEHPPVKRKVAGSSPAPGAKKGRRTVWYIEDIEEEFSKEMDSLGIPTIILDGLTADKAEILVACCKLKREVDELKEELRSAKSL
jgi:hypothetical protein